MSNIEGRVRLAQNDVKHSRGLYVVGSLEYIRSNRDRKKEQESRRTVVIACGDLERGESWNTYVNRVSFEGIHGTVIVETHTAFDKTDDGLSVLEVVLFDNKLHANSVYENMERKEREKLEVIEH